MTCFWRLLPWFCAFGLALLAGPSQADSYRAGSLEVLQPWSQALPPNAPTVAAYFIVRNTGMADDRLLSVDSPVAAEAQLHEHVGADGMMKMQQVSTVIIPAAGQVRFAPFSSHVMLLGLGDRSQLAEGSSFPLTLHFQGAGAVEVQVRVLANPPAGVDDAGAGG
jgi:copper(I)-binding protein